MTNWIINQENQSGILPYIRQQIDRWLSAGPVCLSLSEPSKTREQEKKYHAMISDIASQTEIDGRMYDLDVWKAWLVDQFEKELKENGEKLKHPSIIVLSLDKQRAVTIRSSTSRFTKSEGAQFIEFLEKFAAENGVMWSETAEEYAGNYR